MQRESVLTQRVKLEQPYKINSQIQGVWRNGGKRCFDLLVAATMLFLLSPLIIFISALVLILEGRPLFYSGSRLGRDGIVFKIWKFRTMVIDAESKLEAHLASCPVARAQWEAYQKFETDPRITKIGHVLRKSSLDELPQLFNVLRGEMSLIGPRPITSEERLRYGRLFDQCFSVLPGLTGIWQISGRNDVDYDRRVELDHIYSLNMSLKLDLRILLNTPFAIFRGK